jgi:hypothetical protein
MSNMANDAHDKKEGGKLLTVLTAHYRALVLARSDKTILQQYASLLRFIKSKPSNFPPEGSVAKAGRSVRPRPVPTINEAQLRNASLDDLHKVVTDAATGRKDLEFIAIHRFSVPRGSMRSFSDKQMLVDKLRTLIGNERAHETIGAVAREQDKRP